MKTLLITVSLFLTIASIAQNATNKVLYFTLTNSDGNVPGVIDTIRLDKGLNVDYRSFTAVPVTNATFSLSGLDNGKYILYGVSKNYFIYPVPVTVCTKCTEKYELTGHVMQEGENRNFSMIQVSPMYGKGFKNISKDFYKALTKKEIKTLKGIYDIFTISFFVTKEKVVSDVTFSTELPQEIKTIINKGLGALKDWLPAMVNGRIMDDVYTLNSNDLL